MDKTAFNIGASGSEYTEKYGFYDPEKYVFKAKKGLNKEIVEEISWMKNEPDWMRHYRVRALELFYKKPMPQWGGNLNDIDFDNIYYFLRATDKSERSWDDVPADIKNTFDRLGIPEAERKFLSGVGAQYECLSGDARVYTARGLVPIRDVQAGDTVFSFNEQANRIIATNVEATAAKGEREIFEVRVGTRTIKATSNHPFLVLDYQRAPNKQRGRYRRVWKYLHELKPGDLVAVAKKLPDVGQTFTLQQPAIKSQVVGRNQSVEYALDISDRYNAINLPAQTSTDLMWWLGLYIGDGFIHHEKDADKARVEFAIPKTDAALRAEFGRVTERVFGLPAKNGDPQRMTVYSTILARFLETNKLDGDAHTKRIPQWVFTLPQEQIFAFLGGYVDADGYVRDHAKNHDVVLTSANETLLRDVKQLGALCGLPTSSVHRFESKHPIDETRTTVGYRVEFAGEFERLGSRSPQRTDRLGKRKYHHDYSSAHNTTFRQHTNEFIGFAKIDSITPAGIEPVFDIQVNGPHNFVAEGLIVHNSEVVYHSIKESLSKQGVIFLGMDQALAEHPDLVKKYFGTVIPAGDNKFAALNSAVWSGGSFIYVPPGVHVDMPLQAYFRINAKNMGQFERTLIIADEGSYVHYVEGCTAPTYSSDSLHSAVVEIIVNKGARVRYTTIQNWSANVYNLVTKRAVAYENATMEWVDCNLGSKLTMKYPAVYMMGEGARGEVLSVAFAGKGQHQDAGAKMVHAAPNTSSLITSKSISKDGGRTSYRGLLKVHPGCEGVKSNVRCDALLLDEDSRSDTYPYIEVDEDNVTIGHEASVSKIGEEQLFYLMSRGLTDAEAATMIVSGFIEPIVKELPMEFAVEMNRLISLQMEGSVG
ncbi:MAG: Fe-S cluster assembly protein SufB [Chloroflexi bacterium]|nr:Fe-S cluster assembly protein SufB [Chloroflexota bacterium]